MTSTARPRQDDRFPPEQVTDGPSLHRLLFPIGQRQREALGMNGTGEQTQTTFHAFHQGIARALKELVTEARCSSVVRRWILLEDAGVAADMLWGPPSHDDAAQQATTDFRRNLARMSDLGDSYCATAAADLRHRLGEHYTPHWLVRKVADRVLDGGVAADPACGDGRFLIALLRNGRPPENLWGTDLNPLAVVMARMNVWNELGRPRKIPPISIEWGDFVLGAEAENVPAPIVAAADNVGRLPQADVYIGNPPWVTWRNLSDEYREAVAARMVESRLNHTRGWAARVSAGQSDMSHIFVHEAVERVAPDGQVAFVLPRSTFKAPIGPGPLREGISTSGRKYRFEEVWDCVEPDPFTGVRTDAVVAFVGADAPHTFPVAWRVMAADGAHGDQHAAVLSDPDDVSSPWMTGDATTSGPLRLDGGERWTLKARGGVNTGGGNSAFHVDVLHTRGATVTIRNVPSRRMPMDTVTVDVEPTYVRPLLRGKDVKRWTAVPSGHIVLPHHASDLRKPVPESELREAAPLTYGYLSHFREFLATRKEVARWGSQQWYTLFRIVPYTAGCWRVVWPHSSNGQLRAAVLRPEDRTVPDQKVILVPFDEAEPALFLAALLNSAIIRDFAASCAGMDASPNLVQRLTLPRFTVEDQRHQAVISLAADLVAGRSADQAQLDEAVARLFTR